RIPSRRPMGKLRREGRRSCTCYCDRTTTVRCMGSGRDRRGLTDAFVDMRLEFGEIVDELADEVLRGPVVFGRIGPGAARVEQLGVYSRHRDGHVEAEIGVLAELRAVEAAVERSVEQRASRLDRHALDAFHRRLAA